MARASFPAAVRGALRAYRWLRSGKRVSGTTLARGVGVSAKTARHYIRLLSTVFGLEIRYRDVEHTWEITGPGWAVRYLDRLSARSGRGRLPENYWGPKRKARRPKRRRGTRAKGGKPSSRREAKRR